MLRVQTETTAVETEPTNEFVGAAGGLGNKLATVILESALKPTGADVLLVEGLGEYRDVVEARLREAKLPFSSDAVRLTIPRDGAQRVSDAVDLLCQSVFMSLDRKLENANDVGLSILYPATTVMLKEHPKLRRLEGAEGLTAVIRAVFISMRTELDCQFPKALSQFCAERNLVYKLEKSADKIDLQLRRIPYRITCFERIQLESDAWSGVDELHRFYICC